MNLYVANCSKFKFQFIYRMASNPSKTISHVIEPGKQELICRDSNVDEIDYIISQHAAYGLKHSKEIKNYKDFTGLCYSIDTPVSVDSYMLAEEINDNALMQRSLDASIKAAGDGAAQIGATGGKVSTIEVQELEDSMSARKKSKKINHTYKIEG